MWTQKNYFSNLLIWRFQWWPYFIKMEPGYFLSCLLNWSWLYKSVNLQYKSIFFCFVTFTEKLSLYKYEMLYHCITTHSIIISALYCKIWVITIIFKLLTKEARNKLEVGDDKRHLLNVVDYHLQFQINWLKSTVRSSVYDISIGTSKSLFSKK